MRPHSLPRSATMVDHPADDCRRRTDRHPDSAAAQDHTAAAHCCCLPDESEADGGPCFRLQCYGSRSCLSLQNDHFVPRWHEVTTLALKEVFVKWYMAHMLLLEPMGRIELPTYSFAYTFSPEPRGEGLDCIFISERYPCQSFGRRSATVLACGAINRYSGFTCPSRDTWAGLCGPPWSCSTPELHRLIFLRKNVSMIVDFL